MAELADTTRAPEDTCGPSEGHASLEDFIGDWCDSMGHEVRVSWAPHRNRGGELAVQLRKPGSNRDPIRLNIKSLGHGRFQCGHFEQDQDRSHTGKIVWADQRNKGKVSEWERRCARSRSRSHGRSRGGTVRVDQQHLQSNLHLAYFGGHPRYLSPPRPAPPTTWQGARPAEPIMPGPPPVSVLRDVCTPGAWAPPPPQEVKSAMSDGTLFFKASSPLPDTPSAAATEEPSVSEKQAKADQLDSAVEKYEQMLIQKASPDPFWGASAQACRQGVAPSGGA